MKLQVWTPPSARSPLIARVIPLTQTRAIKGLWDYELPPELAEAGVGSLLRVPFSGRTILAVVAEMAVTSDVAPEKLVTVAGLLPARLPADLVALAVWMAAEYCSTPARALQILLPAGATQGLTEKQVLVASISPAGLSALEDADRLTPGQRDALAALIDRGPTVASTLGTPLLRRLESRGLVTLNLTVQPRRASAHTVSSTAASAPPLTAEQEAALLPIYEALAASAGRGSGRRWQSRVPPPRRHRLWKDGGVSASGAGDSGAGKERDHPRAGDRADPTGPRTLPGALRRHRRRDALGHERREASRRVAAPGQGRGQGLRRPPLGRVRTACRHRSDRGRRGT